MKTDHVSRTQPFSPAWPPVTCIDQCVDNVVNANRCSHRVRHFVKGRRKAARRLYRHGVALLWLPVDGPLIDAMTVLARSSWAQENVDATWHLTGWPDPEGQSLSRQVFEKMEYSFIVAQGDAERWIGLRMRFDPDRITGFLAQFAVFEEEWDRDDPDSLPEDPQNGWETDILAGRARFDEVWSDGCRLLETRSGPAQARGTFLDKPWNYAVWRMGHGCS